MAAGDAEGALLAISSALGATATRHFGRPGRSSYKAFLHKNLSLITRVGFGRTILNINLRYRHPDLKATPGDSHPIQDILYHVVRCGLSHSAALPETLRFVDERKFQVEDDLLVLPSSLIYGFIVSVVVCPENSDQSLSDEYGLNVCGIQVMLNDLWGRRDILDDLFEKASAI